MNSIVVTLAGKEYEVKPLPRMQAKAFRQRLTMEIDGITHVLKLADKADKIELTALSNIADMIDKVGGKLAGSVDLIADLLFDFSPELSNDRERIEAEGYDDEIIIAFMEALKLLYPFGQLGQLFQNGR